MLDTLRLKFGHAAQSPPEVIKVTPVTVFVGPNNSGKSKVLTEIEQYCRSGQKNANTVILDEVTFTGLAAEAAARAVDRIIIVPGPGYRCLPGHVLMETARGQPTEFDREFLIKCVSDPAINPPYFCPMFLDRLTLMLDGTRRINMVSQQPGGDLQKPRTSLQALFSDDAKRQEVRRILEEAFGLYFVIDATNLGQLRIRFSQRPPSSNLEERGIHEEAVRFHADALPIDETSDGVKAFTGLIAEVAAGDPSVLLIDEPEAFLHPALAFKLGHELSRIALRADKRVFASTHSPTFVMGCNGVYTIWSSGDHSTTHLSHRCCVSAGPVQFGAPSDDEKSAVAIYGSVERSLLRVRGGDGI